MPVSPPEEQKRAPAPPARRVPTVRRPRPTQAARRPQTEADRSLRPVVDARTGTVGVYSNSTSVATKTNTPLVNIPQSVTVVTKEFIPTRAFRASPRSPAMCLVSPSTRAKATATSS